MEDKHIQYADSHIPGEVFWGIGIENETYIEVRTPVKVTRDFFLTKHGRERYSVDYWPQYKPAVLKAALESATFPTRLPFLYNGHSLTKCDAQGQHRTTYAKVPTPNPAFSGTTLLEDLSGANPAVFGYEANHTWWRFDGDTIEFITQDFRCTTVEASLRELIGCKTRWIDAFRAYTGLDATWPSTNHGFAVFATNPSNVGIFNNGTIHLNWTVPTLLDKNGEIDNWPRFEQQHRNLARLLQWLEPFWVAKYSSPDPFANMPDMPYALRAKFPAGGQRLAASRYIGVGTYDTETMPTGKLLTEERRLIPDSAKAGWEAGYNRPVAYEVLDRIGYDINFHKFKNHGVELRIFDWVPPDQLLEIMRTCVWAMDRAVTTPSIPNPQDSKEWHTLIGTSVWNGADALISPAHWIPIASALGIPWRLTEYTPLPTVLKRIETAWCGIWGKEGPCSSRMLETLPLVPIFPTLLRMPEHVPTESPSPLIVRVRLYRIRKSFTTPGSK
jgi:hypothetical protein